MYRFPRLRIQADAGQTDHPGLQRIVVRAQVRVIHAGLRLNMGHGLTYRSVSPIVRNWTGPSAK